jgi:hypothetical protein
MTPFKGCGSEISLKKWFYCSIIFQNPERVIAFRIGHRPIKMGKLFFTNSLKYISEKPLFKSSRSGFFVKKRENTEGSYKLSISSNRTLTALP